VHPRAAAQGRCANTSQQASPPSPARDACTFKSSTSTRLSPYGCRTGYATRVPCTYPPGCRGNEKCICVISMRIQGAYNDYYLPEPLESHREHEEPCSLWASLLPRHVGSTHFLSIPIDVPNQRVVMHHETRRLPSSPVRCGVMAERKHVRPGVASSRKWHVRRRTGAEWAHRRGQLEEHAVVVGLREAQLRDVGRPLRRRGVPEAVDADFTAVFERRGHVGPRRKEGKVPNATRCLVILNLRKL